MTSNRFFRGFLAALRINEVTYLNTVDDDHHRRFAQAVRALQEQQRRKDPAALEMPQGLVSNPFTGRFDDFDDALVRMQQGMLGAQNPYYPGIRLVLTDERAERILEAFDDDQREVFSQMAERYLDASLDDARSA
jgi:hypothetical protein